MKHSIRKVAAVAASAGFLFSAICATMPGFPTISAETITPPYSCPAVYDALIAMQNEYPEGMPWTNDNFYAWNGGGTYYGGFGCVAFAYLMSDAAFGTLPCTEYTTFDPTMLRTGDLLRASGHTVIVLEVRSDSVIVAEGNYNSSIHWGREISFDTFYSSSFEDYTTRYPEEFVIMEDRLQIEIDDSVEPTVISRDALNLTWESADPAVATVDENGQIVGVADGITTITASTDTHTETIEITVGDPTDENGIPIGLTYEVDTEAGFVTIISYQGEADYLGIPDKIEGYPVTEIGDYALSGNETVATIRFPSMLERIGAYAFSSSALTAASIPASVNAIGAGAFENCTALPAIAVDPENEWYYVMEGVLYDIQSNTLLTYPAGKNDEIYTISEGISCIAPGAFSGVSLLADLHIPSTMESVTATSFSGCTGLQNFHVSSESTAYLDVDGVLYSTDNALVAYPIGNERTSYAVEDGTVTILDYAFSTANTLTSVTFPNTLVTIEICAFLRCKTLTAIRFPGSVTTIKEAAFYGCDALETIIIPSNVTTIEDDVFASTSVTHTIYGYAGSYAEIYAKENWIPFETLSDLAGDLDQDLSLTIADAILLNRFLVEDPALTLNNPTIELLDCNGDTIVDTNDSIWLLTQLADL